MRKYKDLNINNDLPIVHLQFFPSIMMLKTMLLHKKISINGKEHYKKQTFRNRAILLSSQGTINIIIPIQKYVQPIDTEQIKIANNSFPWQTYIWRTIYSCYGRSPFFEYYSEDLKKIIFQRVDNLLDFDLLCFDFINQKMNLGIQLFRADKFIDRKEYNYTFDFEPKNYISQGKDLLPYNQEFEERFGFVANLSSLDLLFCLGPQSLEYLQNN